jgi:carboxymethylenebutenolidase
MSIYAGEVIDTRRVRGENIEFKSGGETITGYLAQPSQSGNYSGIVVIHEAFGLDERIRDIARRLANIGYNALAPDLYAREGGPSDPLDINTVFPVMFGKSDAEAVQDLGAAAAHLRALPGATGKIGAIGLGSGGRQTLLFACSSNKVDAAVDWWGGFIDRATPVAETTAARPTPILNMVDRLNCPLLAAFGDEDQQSKELKSRAQRTGKDVMVKVYKNAGQVFFADYRPSDREDPVDKLRRYPVRFLCRRLFLLNDFVGAHELWRDAIALVDSHLKS